jgi:cytochrome b involved in lipid metabolism
MSSRKTVTRVLATSAALPLIFGGVLASPAHAAEGSAQPAKKYTMAQVKTHNKASNCWTVVGTGVYNVTAWIPKHPGGKGVIISMCGKSGTAKFFGVHKSSSSAKAALSRYKIGTL